MTLSHLNITMEAPRAIRLVIYFVIRAVDIKLLKVKLKSQYKDLKRTLSICWYWLFSISPTARGDPWDGWPHTVRSSGSSGCRAHRLPHYHLPTETRVPFNKLTGTTGPQNNKQIHGVVFVIDKGLSLSLMLLEGFGGHSNHLLQIVSSHISLIWSCHFDTLTFIWWQSFEDTRKAIRVCGDFIDMSYVSTCALYWNS